MMLFINSMRTTVTIDDTVEKRLRQYAGKHSLKFKQALNEVLRKGLAEANKPQTTKPYKTKPKMVGLKSGLNYDNVAELIEQVEGPSFQ